MHVALPTAVSALLIQGKQGVKGPPESDTGLGLRSEAVQHLVQHLVRAAVKDYVKIEEPVSVKLAGNRATRLSGKRCLVAVCCLHYPSPVGKKPGMTF